MSTPTRLLHSSSGRTQYHLDWIYCAENTWNFTVDFMGADGVAAEIGCYQAPADLAALVPVSAAGIWNERDNPAEDAWIKQLRAALDAAGYVNTRIVAKDTKWNVAVSHGALGLHAR